MLIFKESFFTTLKKEKLYRIDTTKLKRKEVKKIVWRFIVYYFDCEFFARQKTRFCLEPPASVPDYTYSAKY